MARQNQEAEADFIALYLLKRAGYDTSEFGRSMKLLGDEPDDPIDYFRALFIDHPRFMGSRELDEQIRAKGGRGL